MSQIVTALSQFGSPAVPGSPPALHQEADVVRYVVTGRETGGLELALVLGQLFGIGDEAR